MQTLIIIIISILPVYLIAKYVYKKDHEKEPKKLLRRLFIWGMVSCIPAAIMEVLVEPIFGKEEDMSLIFMFIYVTIGIAFVEEICKWFIVYINAYNDKEFDHIYDAVVYCVFASLGFACLENILYVSLSGVVAGILRAITAVPGHAADAVVMGNYLGLAKASEINNDRKQANKYIVMSIIMPTITHGIYDYCIFTGNTIFLLIFLIFLIGIYIYSIKKIKAISSIVNNFNGTENNIKYCPHCGIKILKTDNYCYHCGKQLNNNNK